MISCTEFIPVYNEFFNFLNEEINEEAVKKFWNNLSDSCLNGLRTAVSEKGLLGCFEYWSRTLSEEAADFKMSLNSKQDTFKIEMHKCPSKGRLNKLPHLKKYPAYCEHCDALYRRVLESLGYQYEIDLSKCDHAKCTITIKDKR